MSFKYFILGLLTQRPMTGYDIKRLLQRLDWLIGSPSFGSVYPTLHALLKDGLVSLNVDQNNDRPARKVYSITMAGRRALQEWLDRPVEPGASLKEFLMRLMLAGNLSHHGLVTYLQQRRSEVAAHRATLEKVTNSKEKTALGRKLAFDYGLAAAKAELAWLDRTLEQLS